MGDRKYGGRDDILQAPERLYEDVFVPELNNQWYRVRGMTGAERERWEGSLGKMKGDTFVLSMQGRAMATLVQLSVVDGDDHPIFTTEDVSKLARVNAVGLSRIGDVARRLSGITKTDMDELEGNSEGDQSDDSSSSSRSLSVAPSPSSSTPSRAAN